MRAKFEMLDRLPKIEKTLKTSIISPVDISKSFHQSSFISSDARSPVSSNVIPIEDDYVLPPTKKVYEKFRRVNTADPGFYAHSAIFASGRVLAGDMFDGN